MTLPSPNIKRGDVVLVLFPNSNITTAKTRPALIVQADNLQTDLPQAIAALITSQMFRANHPSRITILLDSIEGQTGLLTNSVVMIDNLATIALSAIYRIIGSLSRVDIDQALKHTLGLQ